MRNWIVGKKVHKALCVVLSITLSGCVTAPRIEDPALRDVANRIDRIDKLVGKWGTASISDVLLIEDKGQFAINYDAKVEDYVSKARESYQAGVWRYVQESVDVKQAQRTLTDADEVAKAAAMGGPQNKALLDAGVTAASAISGVAVPQKGKSSETGEELGDEGQVEQSIPSFTSILPESNSAASVLSSDKFTDPLPHADPPGGISERRAMLTGINDKMTENILKYLAHPTGLAENTKIYLGIIEVTCNPGWATREGYAAEITVTPEYAKNKTSPVANTDGEFKSFSLRAESLVGTGGDSELVLSSDKLMREDKGMSYPSVLAAFPLQEAQSLDLRNSERNQEAMVSYIASLLVAQGSSEQAEKLMSRVKREEYDGASRSMLPVVSSFASGGSFGFQFMPAYQALGDPADRKKGSANRLQPYSFPALIIVACDDSDIYLDKEGKGLNGGERGGWTHLVLNTTTRWVPVEKGRCRVADQLGARERIAIAAELRGLIREVREDSGTPQQKMIDSPEVRRQIRAMMEISIGKTIVKELPRYKGIPTPVAPSVTSVLPDRGFYNANTVLTIRGEGFTVGTQSIVKSVTVGGRLCDFQVAGPGVIIAVVPAWTDNPSNHKHEHDKVGEVVVATTKGAVAYPTPIKFDRHLAVTPGSSPAEISVTRDAQGNVTGIVVNETGTTKDSVLELFGGALGGGDSHALDLSDVDLSVTVK